VAAVAQSLTAWLGERHGSGEQLQVAPSWRIDENRWSACRHGVEGLMADLDTGESRPTVACLEELLETLEPWAERLGCGAQLRDARRLIERNGAIAQRAVAADSGIEAVAPWLASRFLESGAG
jgi:carboxylate-amine ligase